MANDDETADGDDDADAALVTINELADRVGDAMIDAADSGHLTARGVVYGVGVALRRFCEAAREIEGWSAEQAKEYVASDLAEAFAFEVVSSSTAYGLH